MLTAELPSEAFAELSLVSSTPDWSCPCKRKKIRTVSRLHWYRLSFIVFSWLPLIPDSTNAMRVQLLNSFLTFFVCFTFILEPCDENNETCDLRLLPCQTRKKTKGWESRLVNKSQLSQGREVWRYHMKSQCPFALLRHWKSSGMVSSKRFKLDCSSQLW